MLRARLARRVFWVVLLIIAVIFGVIYIYTVPLIQREVYAIERNSARLALNNVFQLANKMHSNLESFREQALQAHKQRLQAVVELTEIQLKSRLDLAREKGLDTDAVLDEALLSLRDFTYGNDGYIWVADQHGRLLSHPDPRFQGARVLEVGGDERGGRIREIIDDAIRDGEGFYRYPWQRLGDSSPIDKLSYVRSLPQLGVVVGSGLYLNDLDAEVEQRKRLAIQEVREALNEIRVAKTGYLFIFDRSGHLLAHPNPNIDQTMAMDLIDPSTGHSIIEELIEVADTGRELHYKWDRPNDSGNYIYDKISLVRSLDGFGWYICSSVYVDELRASSEVLSQRILAIALISILAAILLALFFINRILHPVRQLALTAERVQRGDLTAQSGIERDDELGMLAHTFDTMVHRLKDNIEMLDSRVQRRTEELARMEQRQRLLLDALPAQIAHLDRELVYLFVNRDYADQFHRDKAAIVGCRLRDVVGERMQHSIQPWIDRCLLGEEVRFEYRFEESGRERITKRILLPERDAGGQVVGIYSLSLDVTVEKEAERQLLEAQRMSAVGQLAGGLAHDFNNLLSVVQGNLLLASERYPGVDGLARYLTPAIRASRRGAEITGRLLAFSRRQTLSPRRVDVKALLAETLELVRGTLPGDIEVIQKLEADADLFVDPGQMENALVNLALNARDAMPEGGQLQFAVSECSGADGDHYDEPVPPGQYVEIRVSDGGPGFSAEACAQAFEPFFSTKTDGRHSGLGLSMVYGFIKQSKGFIAIGGGAGEGAVISLLLPVMAANAAGERHDESGDERDNEQFDGKLVLLVEDDADVRAVVREQLNSLGLAVIEAEDADEAAALLDALQGLDGLVSDIRMPGKLNGFGLASRMQERFSEGFILLISGYTDEMPASGQAPCWRILRKPFDRAALVQALADAQQGEKGR